MMYELLYILPSRYTDTEVEEIQKKIDALIQGQASGTIVREEILGKIRMAYPIGQTRHGTYVLIYFTTEPSVIPKLDAQFHLTEEILRYTILQAEPGSEKKEYHIEAYIAPLSEEDIVSRSSRSSAPRAAAPIVESVVSNEEAIIPKEETPISMEELNKKLDEILDAGDITENV
ncbi:MAG: 30S ribosomal protein S6 [Candidatus Uhrbacteria bacterium GW2011_GWF2_41_16]|nr:MAG: 30S ribosomal protein S6 [Candidatus Uhrbacteria bacterium GW2011_GWC2_41_11]KKR98372.1 MAG: 30S ribosomal protein S6 [Candidatus Uhrbacteria bacterium GW2011_GWF2_41_16]